MYQHTIKYASSSYPHTILPSLLNPKDALININSKEKIIPQQEEKAITTTIGVYYQKTVLERQTAIFTAITYLLCPPDSCQRPT